MKGIYTEDQSDPNNRLPMYQVASK
jgi:hypothetical protein